MSEYVLSCCTTADLSEEHFKRRNISYICFHFMLDGVQYDDDLGKSVPFDVFYEKMAAGAETSTSQINIEEFVSYFTSILKQGKDILHVCLSSGISGVYNSACIAAKALADKFPERKILVVDSLAASSGYGLLMDKLADLRDEGMGIEELCSWAEKNKLRLNHWFFSTDLTFYVKGGRISKASGWFGTALKICPLLNMDHLGRLIPRMKVRTKERVIKQIVAKMQELADGGADYDQKCYISQSNCPQDAQLVADGVSEYFTKLSEPVCINSIGTTIGSHTGPGTVALFFWGTERTE